jgi:5-methylcytosine-specific restriction endonuclease McrA
MRNEFSAKTKMSAHKRSGGHCENESCGLPFDPSNPAEYHHVIEDYFNGRNDIENCQVLCAGCHRTETKTRAGTIAKSRRLIKRAAGIKKPGKFRRPDGYKYNWSAGRYERI